MYAAKVRRSVKLVQCWGGLVLVLMQPAAAQFWVWWLGCSDCTMQDDWRDGRLGLWRSAVSQATDKLADSHT